jgi:hypothetical protein
MRNLWIDFRDFFVSLRLTVVLLILSMILVFVATLDQVNLGIWAVQEKYFRSFAVLWPIPNTSISIPVFPGGYFIGGLLLVNLIAAHVYRFQFTLRKIGIQLAHAGLILLLVGELLTGFMRLDTGETKRYSESFHDNELVFIDRSNADHDDVVSIPEAALRDLGTLQHARLPFRVAVKAFYPNANLQMRNQGPQPSEPSLATQGLGTRVNMIPLPVTYKPNERNIPGTYVELSSIEGSLGTFLASPLFGMPQTFQHEGRTWEIALRAKRYYKPFSLTLLKFSHDRYPGTEIPKNFSSRVRVQGDDGDDREVLIFMNNPLRYGGLTFYQAGFDNNDTTTVLQVVRNPGWLLPYVACVMMGLGLTWQFLQSLGDFIRRRRNLSQRGVREESRSGAEGAVAVAQTDSISN